MNLATVDSSSTSSPNRSKTPNPGLIADTSDGSSSTGLFNRKPTPRHSVDTVTVSVRLPADAIATIDKLARDTNAASRTDLLVTALANYL